MLGDCLECMKEIPDGSVDMVLTDPPYGTTACKWDSVIPFEPMWVQLKRIVKPNGAIVLMASQPFTSALVMSNIAMFKYVWYWNKLTRPTGFLNAKKQPLRIVEDIVVFYANQSTYNPEMKPGPTFKATGSNPKKKSSLHGSVAKKVGGTYTHRYPTNLIGFVKEYQKRNGTNHPTVKPVALMEYLIKTYTNEGETVLDFTMGSGTTGVAAANTGRRFIGVELDQKYFEIAVNRMSKILPL